MEGEIWKELPGFETYLLVSNLGWVKGLPRRINLVWGVHELTERIIKQCENRRTKKNLIGTIFR